MRKIQELLRLKYEQKCTHRDIATSLNISAGTVSTYLSKARQHQLSWPLPQAFQDEDKLYALLFPKATQRQALATQLPEWSQVHHELKRHKHVTLYLLWQEYRQVHPMGLGYSQFCHRYRQYKKQLDVSMRQTHVYGEKCFVDYSGITVPWIDAQTGAVFQAEIFVGVLGASNYTFAEATHSQGLRDWIGSHCRMFEYFNGVPTIVVPDNLKSGVTKADYYDPDINPTYQELANHYGVAVIPTRVKAPKDKAKVEVGVQGVERRLLAPLRAQQFFSVDEINQALKPLLAEYNRRPFQKMAGSRHTLFLTHEQAKLAPLPSMRYQFAKWHKAKPGIDYHVAIDKHYYSVPFHYASKPLHIRISANVIECFYKQKKIAIHRRAFTPGHTTHKAHMPKHHQAYAQWNTERLLQWASKTGEHTQQLIQKMIKARVVPQQAFRGCLGVLRLADKYGQQRLEQAAQRALAIGATRYKNLASILKNGLDKLPLPGSSLAAHTSTLTHSNVRGDQYYQ